MTALATLAWAAAGLALVPLSMALRNLRLFRVPTQAPSSATRVSILIPARNEEAQIIEAVQAALGSVGVEVEVVVLDDQSTDATAVLVRQMAAADPRVRLASAPPLPPGWAGKQRACHLLGQAARFEVLLFVDADVRLEPHAAALAAGRLLSNPRFGMVSGFPQEVTVSLAERLVIPWIHVLLLGYLPMDWMRISSRPGFGAACGQWVIARRDAYVQVGGHGAAPASRHDGISLPRCFRAAGWLTDVFDGTGLASCRMYTDFGSVWHGFGKSAGEGMATPLALPVWTLLIAGGHLLPWLLLPLGLALGQTDVALAGAVGVAANLLLRLLLRRRLRQSLAGALLHPLGAVLTLAINWTALVRHLRGRPSVWRGRHYVRGGGGAAVASETAAVASVAADVDSPYAPLPLSPPPSAAATLRASPGS